MPSARARRVPEQPRRDVLLVVVDERERTSLSMTFHQHGYHVEATASMEEAQPRLDEQRPPTALVSDVRLGPFNGLHLAMLAAHLPFTSSVLLDEDYDNMRQSQAMHFGALYLVKPLDHTELARYVLGYSRATLGDRLPLVR